MFCTEAKAQSATKIPSSEIAGAASEVSDATSLIGLDDEIVVSGDFLWDGYFLGAKRLVFEPGARLVFSNEANQRRGSLILAAEVIVNLDQTNPGTITWDRLSRPDALPAVGQSESGGHGQDFGNHGVPGANGAQGATGLSGFDAPKITIFVKSFKGAPVTIDFRGADGGAGGQGLRGGDGGIGHAGLRGSDVPWGCKRGAGYGGNGGNGGIGGPGGVGGSGGAGGAVTLVSLPDAFPILLDLLRVDVAGGVSGQGGQGGSGGRPGAGGLEGAPSVYCKAEPGRRGRSGADGGVGENGNS